MIEVVEKSLIHNIECNRVGGENPFVITLVLSKAANSAVKSGVDKFIENMVQDSKGLLADSYSTNSFESSIHCRTEALAKQTQEDLEKEVTRLAEAHKSAQIEK